MECDGETWQGYYIDTLCILGIMNSVTLYPSINQLMVVLSRLGTPMPR